jgi:hypothetical protein
MEITGFDEQIGFVRKIAKAAKKASTFVNKKMAFMPQPKVVAIKRVMPSKGVTPAQSIAAKKMQSSVKPSQIRIAPTKGSIFNKMKSSVKPSQIRIAPTKGSIFNKMKSSVKPSQIRIAPTKTVAVKRSMINKLIAAKKIQAPVQKSPIVTAQQFKTFKSTTQASQPVKVFSTDQRVTPTQLKSMSDVQRSFAKVDLPYQSITPPTKFIKVKNSPINLPVNINMIEPAVDQGVNNYYGK